MYAIWPACGDQRIALRSQCSPFLFMCPLDSELRLPGLYSKDGCVL